MVRETTCQDLTAGEGRSRSQNHQEPSARQSGDRGRGTEVPAWGQADMGGWRGVGGRGRKAGEAQGKGSWLGKGVFRLPLLLHMISLNSRSMSRLILLHTLKKLSREMKKMETHVPVSAYT